MGKGGSDYSNIRKREIYRVTIVGMVVNIIVTITQFAVGFIGRSSAMIADAIHSLSDLASDILVLGFTKVASKPSDENHSYGHGKYETIATIIISIILFIVALTLSIHAIELIVEVLDGKIIPKPKIVALIIAIISIFIKEYLYRYTDKVSKKIDSAMLKANAWHHRSDAFSSIGVTIGIAGAYFLSEQWRVLDPIAAIIVSIFILRVSIKLFMDSFSELVEKSLPKEVQQEIMEIVLQNHQAKEPHRLRTRKVGHSIAVDVHVRVDALMSVRDSHKITEEIEAKLRERFGQETIVNIHIEPYE